MDASRAIARATQLVFLIRQVVKHWKQNIKIPYLRIEGVYMIEYKTKPIKKGVVGLSKTKIIL